MVITATEQVEQAQAAAFCLLMDLSTHHWIPND